MKKITALVLNDEEETAYYTVENSVKQDILVHNIYFDYQYQNVSLPMFVIELDDNTNIEVPYHSVLLIRREK